MWSRGGCSYSHVLKPDAKTHLLRSLANEWRDVHGLSAAEIARQIRADRIDVLVELAGHTAGNLLDVVAMRPAPIQVAYCGYPNTTGLESVQYRLTDAWADPPDTKQEFVEQLVRLPRCFLCYTPSAEAGPESVAPCLGSGGVVTIGSFNNLSKINARVLRCWLTVLQRVPNSRLMLKCKPFASASVQQQFLDMFSARGIDPSRIDLLPLLPLNNQHMQSYSLVDLTLDTFPYAGTTTTCEALWMGVPVVTLRGPCHAQNVGVSLLTAIGQQALIADTEEEYCRLAVALATDVTRLVELRKALRSAVQKHLSNGPEFVVGLEDAYRTMWHTYIRQNRNQQL
eukprot:TRINITY_DN934_c0_g1_i2.p1 TRINITY_DN934_c0_g1~~TRINITY_DN934_c0_g1_i2.p1  ORF type:complete len:341 (+),score=60.95 TRINITY_DN934_c0_g1_i2:142-1164(+)